MSASSNPLLDEALALAQEPGLQQHIIACLQGFSLGLGNENPAPLCMNIAAHDQMLLHSLGEHRDAGAAVSQYFGVGLQQYHALAQALSVLQPHTRRLRILDFACGFGRALRFLAHTAPGHLLHAAEIQADALNFIRNNLNIPTLLSTPRPADFSAPETYDLIWVVSLFSHLPDALFSGWLEKLTALLSDDGLLCFSVRGASQLPAGQTIPSEGLLYQYASEVSPLDIEIYGTSYVTDAYVMQKIREACSTARVACVKKALANEQDMYFVTRNPNLDLDALAATWRHGVWGWVDIHTRKPDGSLHIEGWAGTKEADEPVTHIDIILDGQTHRVIPNIPRPDVAQFLESDALLNSGWRLQLPPTDSNQRLRLQASAVTSKQQRLLYYGYL